jgi:pimeloyl-ACP methyl ester carboxylesterase
LSAKWTLGRSGLVKSNQKIGLIGISFSGGLCLSAAGRAGLQKKIRSVFSFGGHADLDRTMTYLVTGTLPKGGTLPPHVYGQAVIVRRFAKQLVPLEEPEKLRAVLLDYLKENFAKVKVGLDTLGPKSRKLVELCLKRRNKELGKILEPVVRTQPSHDSLSPIRGRPPSCPVFLLHGSVDNVIPPSETRALARWAGAGTKTTTLITDLIKHVDLKDYKTSSSYSSYYRLIRFWTELLRS